MTHYSPTQLNHEPSRREVILTATLDLIASGGVDSVTHRRVAKHADVPLGSTTYYFKTREDLIRAAFDLYLTHHAALQAQVTATPGTDLTAAVEFLIAFSNLEFEQRHLLLTEYEMTLFAARDELLGQALNNWYEHLTDKIASSLQDIVTQSSHSAARAVLHLLRGHQLERLTNPAEDADVLRKRLTTLIHAYQSEDTP